MTRAETMMIREIDAVSEIRAEILGYFDEHPNACDSVEAIQQWWVMRRVYRYSLEKISKALDQLVAANLVERRCISGGHEVYARVEGRHANNETTV